MSVDHPKYKQAKREECVEQGIAYWSLEAARAEVDGSPESVQIAIADILAGYKKLNRALRQR